MIHIKGIRQKNYIPKMQNNYALSGASEWTNWLMIGQKYRSAQEQRNNAFNISYRYMDIAGNLRGIIFLFPTV